MGERLHTTTCHVDEASTRDGVPVNVSVTVSWQAQDDAGEAGPPVASSCYAIDRLTQALLRRWVELLTLVELLCGHGAVGHAVCEEIGARASQRGMTIHLIGVCEVCLPPSIQAKADAVTLLALHRCMVRHRR